MFLVVELLLIVLLSMVLFMIYQSERALSKKTSPKAKIEEFWNGEERRKYVRFKKALEVTYAVDKRPHPENSGKTIDISEGGMKLLLEEKFPKGTTLSLEIALSERHKKTMEMKGEVVWSEDAAKDETSGKRLFRSGIKFLAMKEPSSTEFINFIRSLASEARIES